MKKSYKRKLVIAIKKFISKIVLFFLFKGFKVTYKYDENVRKEIDLLPDKFTAIIDTGEKNTKLIIQKNDNNIVRLKDTENANIEIVFKNIDSALLMFTGRLGVSRAYAEHRFLLKGEIAQAMCLVRCIDIVEAYLFPKIITKNILKYEPSKNMGLLKTYILVLVTK